MKTIELKVPELQELLEKLEVIKGQLQEDNKKANKSEKWLDNNQVAVMLGISKRTLQTYRDIRILPFSQIGRKIYYLEQDIHDYLVSHYIKVGSQKGGVL